MTTRVRKLLGILLLVSGIAMAHFTGGGTVGWLGILGVFAGTLVAIWPKNDPIPWTPAKVGYILAAVAVAAVTQSDNIFVQLGGWSWGFGALFLIWFKESP